jgi:hypothetical protein
MAVTDGMAPQRFLDAVAGFERELIHGKGPPMGAGLWLPNPERRPALCVPGCAAIGFLRDFR